MKRQVTYDPAKSNMGSIVKGKRAVVWPLDHDDTVRVSNNALVWTSEVVAVNPDLSFETRNSYYKPIKAN
jgi:hypothetical protein